MPKKIKPEELSHENLQPLIDWCEANKSKGGFGPDRKSGIAEVMRRFTEITGETPTRTEFQRWLRPAKADRVQPRFGTGLILVRIHKEITEEEKAAK